MGTTGGDREQLVADAEAAGTYAVIAPNMGKQVGKTLLTLFAGFSPNEAWPVSSLLWAPTPSPPPTWASRSEGLSSILHRVGNCS